MNVRHDHFISPFLIITFPFPFKLGFIITKYVPGSDNLTNSVGIGSLPLDLDSHDSEQENLDGGAACIPKGPTDTILPGYIGALQDGGSPCPLLS